MEINKITYSLALILAIASCAKEEQATAELTGNPEEAKEFIASMETGIPTRTHLAENNIIWDASDEIAVFNASTRLLKYGVKEGTDGSSTATLECLDKNITYDGSLPSNVAYYPYGSSISATADNDGTNLQVSIPSSQTYTKDSYDKLSFPMCAATADDSDYSLKFYNVMGLLKFRFKGENLNVRSVTVKGNNNEILAGKATVACASGQYPKLKLDSEGETTVNLDCGSGVKLSAENATDFFIALPPVVFTKGITVTINTDDKVIEKSTTLPLSIIRSSITPMDPLVPYTYVSSVSLDKSSSIMERGKEMQLFATVLPEEATVQTVTWTSSDPDVATVSESGIISAIKEGKTTITVTTVDGNKTASCEIEVIVGVDKVTLDANETDISLNGTKKLTASITPEDATNKTLIWSSSDSTIATVSDGTVSGIKEGTAIITVTSVQSGASASCKVNVHKIAVTGIVISNTRAELELFDTFNISADVLPSDASNKNISWKVENESILTWYTFWNCYRASGEGTTVITATSEDGGFQASCIVRVKSLGWDILGVQYVNGITLDQSSLKLLEGRTVQLKPTITPSDARNKNVTWSSSDEAVATVASDGTVTGLKKGSCTITCRTDDGYFTAECIVNVLDAILVESISLDKTSIDMFAGETETITATILPEDASIKDIVWTSSDKSVVTVTDGIITALKPGSSIVTATTVDGGKTASCMVTVKNRAVESISLNKESITIISGDSESLMASIFPSNASVQSVSWTSSNASVATVDANGTVTGKTPGTATVTVTTTDGGKTASCNVTVTPRPVESISLDKTTLSLKEGSSETLIATIYPSTASDKNVTWTSSDSSIASVDANGKVTGKDEGTATITVTTKDGGKQASCIVTVKGSNSIGEGGNIITPNSVR